MSRSVRIALVISWSLAYCRSVMRGVRQYAAGRADWIITPVDPEYDLARALTRLRPDGVIAHVYSTSMESLLLRRGIPTINVSGVLEKDRLWRVGIDDEHVGRTAAEHLLARGLRSFAYVGFASHGFAVRRGHGFADELARHGASCARFGAAATEAFRTQGSDWGVDRRLLDWLGRQPRPLGVFCCNDLWGFQIAEAARQLGCVVPHDLAIVGVDDDDLLCNLARPSLSSIQVPGERIGFEAARRLDPMLLRPSRAPGRDLLLPAIGVRTRESSDMIACEDRDVADAIRFIRSATGRRIAVSDVLAEVPVGRRTLERRFRRAIGRGIWDEIQRNRLAAAQRWLAGTAWSMTTIAQRSGFASSKDLAQAFRRHLNLTPGAYRRQVRPSG
ncbi:MAG TPA: substrate-binding domain-containing protein [Tepidisphaeraceae bacterium]|nr:substrate-binding domain-containing protein [Tepidisphaeraceae bacterium]